MDQIIGARFWAKVNCAGSKQAHMTTCCWEWCGSKNKDGYGRFRVNQKLQRAHAVSLSWYLNYTPKYVMHLCDNPACVRPSHLKEGTHSLNMFDAYAKKRRPKCVPGGTHHYKSRFSRQDIFDIRRRYSAGETQANIGKIYNVHQSHISQIVRGKTYRSLLPCKSS